VNSNTTYKEDFQGELKMPAFLMDEIYKIYFFMIPAKKFHHAGMWY